MQPGVASRYNPATRTSPLSPTPKDATRSTQLPPLTYPTPPKPSGPEEVAHLLSGLRTPPTEDMGTTYHAPNIAPYEGHPHASIPGYPASMAQADRTRTALSDVQAALDGYPPRYPPHSQQPTVRSQTQVPQQQQQSSSQQPIHQVHYSNQQQLPSVSSRPVAAPAQQPPSQPTSYSTSRPGTPKSNRSVASQGSMSRKDVASLAGQSLEIPTCISSRGGRLADLAAQLTCFFWFESRKIHQLAENFDPIQPVEPVRRLTQHAIPSQNFKAWVQGILSTTQVTQNVVLLALLFIHRLKVGNPNVKGRAGSEYRLLTVALMLGNKFLDDNTYTNKTWAEVSGISVQEIHVMEVEFLSNMRYSLLVSKEKWEEWLIKLAKLWEYCEAATKPISSPVAIPSPTHFPAANSPIASPTGNLLLTPSAHANPPPPSSYLPNYPAKNPTTYGSNSQWPAPIPGQIASPLAGKPEARNGLVKRPLNEEDPTEPPAKRVSRQPQSLPPQGLPIHNHARQTSVAPLEALRLPVPNLTLNTNPQVPTNPAYNTVVNHVPAQQSALSLPPLVPGVRAMATVYPSSTTNYSPNLVVTSSGPVTSSVPQSVSTPLTATAPSGFPPTTNYGTPTKRHSPGSLTPAAAAALGNSSPLSESFHGHSGVRTPISHSPSVYLQHRASPYRPVRHVNTLLYPPPSASLHEYHLSGPGMIPPTQMHYQPLGRRNEFRTGIVPEFTNSTQQQYLRQGGSVTPLFPPVLASQQQQQHLRPVLGHPQGSAHPSQPHVHYPN